MKIILNSDIAGLGRKFEVKNVADGYALNFLFPQGLAKMGTAEALKSNETSIKKASEQKKLEEELLAKNVSALSGVVIKTALKANEQGHLFSAIHQKEIAELLERETRLSIPAQKIILEKPIKKIGEFSIKVSVGKDLEGTFKLVVEALKEEHSHKDKKES